MRRVQAKDTLEAHVTEHFRLSGVYWGLTALYLMGKLDIVDGAAIVEWVRSVQQLIIADCQLTFGLFCYLLMCECCGRC